jgi:hypothetical protein
MLHPFAFRAITLCLMSLRRAGSLALYRAGERLVCYDLRSTLRERQMSEMVDRVARAIIAGFDEVTEPDERADCLKLARAAIEAMREPTEEMERAFMLQGTKRMNFKLQFKAAIAAALGKVDA